MCRIPFLFRSIRKAISKCMGDTVERDEVILAETAQNVWTETCRRISVDGDSPPSIAGGDGVTVRFKLVVDKITDPVACSDAYLHLAAYTFIKSKVNGDGSMNEEMNREEPCTLHIIGGSGL